MFWIVFVFVFSNPHKTVQTINAKAMIYKQNLHYVRQCSEIWIISEAVHIHTFPFWLHRASFAIASMQIQCYIRNRSQRQSAVACKQYLHVTTNTDTCTKSTKLFAVNTHIPPPRKQSTPKSLQHIFIPTSIQFEHPIIQENHPTQLQNRSIQLAKTSLQHNCKPCLKTICKIPLT